VRLEKQKTWSSFAPIKSHWLKADLCAWLCNPYHNVIDNELQLLATMPEAVKPDWVNAMRQGRGLVC